MDVSPANKKRMYLTILLLSVGFNVHFIYNDHQLNGTPQFQNTTHISSNDRLNIQDQKTSTKSVSMAVRTDIVPTNSQPLNLSNKDCVVDTKNIETSSFKTTQVDQQNGGRLLSDSGSDTDSHLSQVYLDQFAQDAVEARTQIEYIIQQAELKGSWEESDRLALMEHALYIDDKIVMEILGPFFSNPNIDMQAPFDI